MLFVFAAAMTIVGFAIGRAIRASNAVIAAALALAVFSGLGAFYVRYPPFRPLASLLGYYYVVLMFEVFFTASGVLLGALARRILAARKALLHDGALAARRPKKAR
jgi:hypothetical protein